MIPCFSLKQHHELDQCQSLVLHWLIFLLFSVLLHLLSFCTRYVSVFKTCSAAIRHGVKVGPGSQDPGPWDPGTRDLGPSSNFKSGTPGPLSKFKSDTPGPPSKFKSETPSPFFNEFIFLRIFHRFFYLSIFCVFFK